MNRGSFRSMSKYKQIIKNIYPTSPDGEMQLHNVTKLVHFCEISPQKILKVSKYIERKAKKDMSKSKIKFVGIALKIYQELIKGCRKNLNLLAGNVLNFIKTSLEGTHPELKIQATETFIKFAEVLDESSQHPELEALVTHFFTMCQDQSIDARMRVRVREEGLRGIRAYMGILDMTDELDAFVTRHTDQENRLRFVPIILENVTYLAEAAPNNPRQSVVQNSVQTLATEVLRDVFTRANISVTSLFRAILGFLDARDRWKPNTFAMLCFNAIYNCLKPQHEQILMTLLLQHLDQNRPANIKKEVVVIMVEFFRESTGHFMQMLDTLSRHLVSSVEIVSQDQRARDYEDHLVLQETIITSIGLMCKKVSSHLKTEAFNFLCDKLSSSKHIKPTGLAGAAMAVLQCLLRVTCELKIETSDPDWISYTSINLLKDIVLHPHYEIRAIVQKICHNLLLAGKSLESYFNGKGSTSVEVNDKLLVLVGEIIRDTIIEQVKIKHNHPENYALIFHTLNIMLHLGNRREFFVGFPLVFAMQKSAAKWKKIPLHSAITINTIIAAYMYGAADLFDCPPLAAYVDEIMEKRKKVNQICPHIEILKVPFVHVLLNPLRDKYTEDVKRKVAVEYVLFDRDHASELLCTTQSCILRNEPRLKRILAKKIHRHTRTLKREATIELPDESNNNEGGMPHFLAGDGGDKTAAEGTTESPVVMKPNSDVGGTVEARALRKRLYFIDMKQKEEAPVRIRPEDPFRKTFDSVAQVCFNNGQSKALLLQTVAKVLDFDSKQVKKTTFAILDGDNPVAYTATADGADFQKPDGADLVITTTVPNKKSLYSAPTNTLSMNFNGNGYFFVVDD